MLRSPLLGEEPYSLKMYDPAAGDVVPTDTQLRDEKVQAAMERLSTLQGEAPSADGFFGQFGADVAKGIGSMSTLRRGPMGMFEAEKGSYLAGELGKGRSYDESKVASEVYATGAYILENIGAGKILKVGTTAGKATASAVARRVAEAMAGEGLTEASQKFYEDSVRTIATEDEWDTRKTLTDSAYMFAVGAGAGGGISTSIAAGKGSFDAALSGVESLSDPMSLRDQDLTDWSVDKTVDPDFNTEVFREELEAQAPENETEEEALVRQSSDDMFMAVLGSPRMDFTTVGEKVPFNRAIDKTTDWFKRNFRTRGMKPEAAQRAIENRNNAVREAEGKIARVDMEYNHHLRAYAKSKNLDPDKLSDALGPALSGEEKIPDFIRGKEEAKPLLGAITKMRSFMDEYTERLIDFGVIHETSAKDARRRIGSHVYRQFAAYKPQKVSLQTILEPSFLENMEGTEVFQQTRDRLKVERSPEYIAEFFDDEDTAHLVDDATKQRIRTDINRFKRQEIDEIPNLPSVLTRHNQERAEADLKRLTDKDAVQTRLGQHEDVVKSADVSATKARAFWPTSRLTEEVQKQYEEHRPAIEDQRTSRADEMDSRAIELDLELLGIPDTDPAKTLRIKGEIKRLKSLASELREPLPGVGPKGRPSKADIEGRKDIYVDVLQRSLAAKDKSPITEEADFDQYRLLAEEAVQLPKYIREFLGEYSDPRKLFLSHMHQAVRALEAQKSLDVIMGIGINGGWLTKRPKGENYVQISGGSHPISNYYAPKEIAESLNGVPIARSHLLPVAVQQLNAMAKVMATVGSLPAQARNHLANTGLYLAAGHNPLAIFGMSGGRASYGVVKDMVMGKWSNEERNLKQDEYNRYGLLGTGQIDEAMEYINSMKSSSMGQMVGGKVPGAAKKLGGKTATLFKRLYSGGDDFWKISMYEAEKSRLQRLFPDDSKNPGNNITKKSVEDTAGALAGNLLPNYSKLSQGIRDLRSGNLGSGLGVAGYFVAPFPSFYAEVARNQKNVLSLARFEVGGKPPSWLPPLRTEDGSVILARSPSMGFKRYAGTAAAHSLSIAAIPAAAAWVFAKATERDADDWGDENEWLSRLVPNWDRYSSMSILKRDEKTGTISYISWQYTNPFGMLQVPARVSSQMARGEDVDPAAAASEAMGFVTGGEIGISNVAEGVSGKEWRGVGRPVKDLWTRNEDLMSKVQKGGEHIAKSLTPKTATLAYDVLAAGPLEEFLGNPRGKDPFVEAGTSLGFRVSEVEPSFVVKESLKKLDSGYGDAWRDAFTENYDPQAQTKFMDRLTGREPGASGKAKRNWARTQREFADTMEALIGLAPGRSEKRKRDFVMDLIEGNRNWASRVKVDEYEDIIDRVWVTPTFEIEGD